MSELDRIERTTALALRFLILIAARTREVLGMERDEISLEERLWQVPATRMKARAGYVERNPSG
jgi:integrase